MTARKRYWLMKSEPDALSIDDLEKVGTEPWNGVRTGAHLHAQHAGRRRRAVLPLQLQGEPGIVGTATVSSAAYPDETQFDPKSDYHDPKSTREDPRWSLVDVASERKLTRTITLDEIKQHADALGDGFALIQCGNRTAVRAAGHRRAMEVPAGAGMIESAEAMQVATMQPRRRAA